MSIKFLSIYVTRMYPLVPIFTQEIENCMFFFKIDVLVQHFATVYTKIY